MTVARPAVLVDRDGTVIVDMHYPRDPGAVRLVPGAAEALATLAAEGYAVVIVSNQSGVGRGLVSPCEAVAVHQRTVALLAAEAVDVAGSYYCWHAPDAGCRCRKPAPGLLLSAAGDLGLDLGGSVVVGDRERDLEAGTAAGCGRGFRLETSTPECPGEPAAWRAIAEGVLTGAA